MNNADFSNMSREQIDEYQRVNCIFCKIAKSEIPARKVHEDDKMLAVVDINPASKGHLLIMPREHYPHLAAVPDDIQDHIFKITWKLARAAKAYGQTPHATIFIANGAAAGQQSPHFIFHLIPRYPDDELEMLAPPTDSAQDDQLKQKLEQRMGRQEDQRLQGLIRLLNDQPELKKLIINDPKGFLQEALKYPELAKLVGQVDIQKLANLLRNER